MSGLCVWVYDSQILCVAIRVSQKQTNTTTLVWRWFAAAFDMTCLVHWFDTAVTLSLVSPTRANRERLDIWQALDERSWCLRFCLYLRHHPTSATLHIQRPEHYCLHVITASVLTFDRLSTSDVNSLCLVVCYVWIVCMGVRFTNCFLQ